MDLIGFLLISDNSDLQLHCKWYWGQLFEFKCQFAGCSNQHAHQEQNTWYKF